jgi:hypothetical protein
MKLIHAACYAGLTFVIAANSVLLYYAMFCGWDQVTMTYRQFKYSIFNEPWEWDPEMLPKMQAHPFMYWMANKAAIAVLRAVTRQR